MNNFFTNVELSLFEEFSVEQVNSIMNRIRVIANDYEIKSISKELTVYNNEKNERLMKNYASCMLIQGRTKSTIKQYLRTLRILTEFTGKTLDEINKDDIRAFIARSIMNGNKKTSVNSTKNYISSFFRWAHSEKIIAENPCEVIGAMKTEKEIRLPFTEIEIDRMRKSLQTIREMAIFELLISSGIRLSELYNLNKEDLNLNTLTLHVRLGKGQKDRITFISKVAAYYISLYLNSREDNNEALILGNPNRQDSKSERLSKFAIERLLKSWSKRSGVENVHPHRFRRTFATKLHNRGMDLAEIQRLLGHANIGTTMTYVYCSNDNIHNSYDKCID